MRKVEKLEVLNMETRAYYSGCGGIEIKDIEHGIETYVVFVAGAWTSQPTAHKAKVYYTAEPYFRYNGYTIKLDECILSERVMFGEVI